MITGFITDSGLELAQSTASGQGWDFAPTDFAVSATAGALDPTRSVTNDVLYQGALDRVDLLSGGYYEFVGSVPSGAVEETQQVREIYLLGKDGSGNEVVFAIGRVDQVVEVGATSGAKFHFVVKLEAGYDAADATLDLTNDPELTDHLADPEAHHVLFSDLRKRVADLSSIDFKNGELITPVGFYINTDSVPPTATITGGQVYIDGLNYAFQQKDLEIELSGSHAIGLEVAETPSGLEIQWQKAANVASDSRYFDYYLLEDGQLVNATPYAVDKEAKILPNAPVVRYFNDRYENVVLEGLAPKVDWTVDHTTQFTVGAGSALIEGYLVESSVATQVLYQHLPDTEYVEDEEHIITGTTATVDRFTFQNRQVPIDERLDLKIYVPELVSAPLVKSTAAVDSLMTDAIERLVEVSYAGKEYRVSDDPSVGQVYLRDSDLVWNLNQVTPPPSGTTFIARFVRMSKVPDDAVVEANSDSVTVEYPNMLVDEKALLEYNYALPRVDALVLDMNGDFYVLHGSADRYNPVPPTAPSGAVVLALIDQNFRRNSNPSITDTRIFNVEQYELSRMAEDIQTMGYYLSELIGNSSDALTARTEGFAFLDDFSTIDSSDLANLPNGEIPVVFDTESGAITLSASLTQEQVVSQDPQVAESTDVEFASQLAVTDASPVNKYEFAVPQIALNTLDQIPDADLYVSIPPAIPAQITTTQTVTVVDDSAAARYQLYEVIRPKRALIDVTPKRVARTFTRTESFPHHLSATRNEMRQPTIQRVNRQQWTRSVATRPADSSNTTTAVVDRRTEVRDWWETRYEDENTVTRPVSHTLKLKDFGENESVARVTWDGVNIPFAPTKAAVRGQRFKDINTFIGFSDHEIRISSPLGTKNQTSHSISVIGNEGSVAAISVSYADKTAIKELMRLTTTVVISQRTTTTTRWFGGTTPPPPRTTPPPRRNTGGGGSSGGIVGGNQWTAGAGGWSNPTRVDPLAQTFTPTEFTSLRAVSLFFTKVVSAPFLWVSECDNGIPTDRVLGSKIGDAESITVNDDLSQLGTPYLFEFEAPIILQPNQEYAFIVGGSDGYTAVRVAELGRFDQVAGRWQTEHPFVFGSFLESSNAVTWTVMPKKAMTFILHSAFYSQTEQTRSLGTLSITEPSDVILADFEAYLPSDQCDAYLLLDLPDGRTVEVDDSSGQILDEPIVGDIPVSLVLKGETSVMPAIVSDVNMRCQRVNEMCHYLSKPFSVISRDGESKLVKVYLDANLPEGTSLAAKFKVGDTLTTLTLEKVVDTPDFEGFKTHVYSVPAGTDTYTPAAQVKLTLIGNASAMPFVRNLRAVIV